LGTTNDRCTNEVELHTTAQSGGETGPLGRQDPALPQVFGRYLLIQRLSRGGMGEIFIAKHGLAGFEKLAVIKKVLPHLAADAQFISRFVDEAQVAIKLQHQNVAQVFEVGRVGDEYFLALEYVEGRDLRRTLGLLGQHKQRLPVDLALFIGREMANGLAYAHRRTDGDGKLINLVHCDISPPNVLVSFEGETKVIDFGIAKSAIRGTATDPKMGFGKFGYMAPEQLIRGGIVDHRTDIYAAGVVLYELLTGQRLYEAGPEPDYRALARKVARGEHKLPSETDLSLAPYDDLVATALRPKVEDRYQTAAEFRDAIQQCLVAVNPTISTDQLGTYMRELFADEMIVQKELHDRVRQAHLSDFEAALHTQAISTVSFAVSAIELDALGNLKEIPKRTSKRMPAAPIIPTPVPPSRPPRSPALDTSSPPTVSMTTDIGGPEQDDHSLADGTGTVDKLRLAPEVSQERRRTLTIALLSGAIVLVATLAFAFSRGGNQPAAAAAVTHEASGGGAMTVVPIEEPKKPATDGSAVAIAPVVEVKADTRPEIKPEPIPTPQIPQTPKKAATTTNPKRHPDRVVKPPVAPRDTTAKKVDALTRDVVGGKFSAVRRDYETYKQKNGMRLEAQWADLATYVQFTMGENLDEGARRIDAFRAKLRE
jgi:serine/threonine protein kinase